MKSKIILLLLLCFIRSFYGQYDSLRKYSFHLETNSFSYLYLPYLIFERNAYQGYQGQNALFGLERNIYKSQSLGLDLGVFYYNDFAKDIPMKYIYFPIYLTYKKYFHQHKHCFKFRIGKSILDYFDSEYTRHRNILDNQFWIQNTEIKSVSSYDYWVIRPKSWLILEGDYGFSLSQKLSLNLGLNLYLSNVHIYRNIILGLNYQFR